MSDRSVTPGRRVRDWLPRGAHLSEESWQTRHRAINLLLWCHVVALPFIGAWQGNGFWHSALEAAPVAGLALAAMVPGAPRAVRASLTTMGLVIASATLVHFFHGMIEIHFHFFVVVALISLYQSWTPYLLGVTFVLLHHAIMGTLAPDQVYNHPAAITNPLLFAGVHGGFLMAETLACLAYWKASERTLSAERLAREQVEEANAALARANHEISDLVGMLSHDLRTPLAAINGFTAVLREHWSTLSDERREDLLRRTGAAGHHLQSMLDDALSVTAIEASGLHAEPQPVRLDQAVRDVLALMVDAGDDHHLDGLEPVVAAVDPGHLSQVLTNLVTNARKYGAPPFTFTTATVGGRAVVTVSDRGEGVPVEFEDRLFDRFARADGHRTGSQKGTGLGLYIARRLVLANGGDLSHRRTDASGGATFTVTLPVAVVPTSGDDRARLEPAS